MEIYSGSGGPWEFEVSLAQLVVAENTIVLEVVDNYGAKTSKTIRVAHLLCVENFTGLEDILLLVAL